jgi:hypothetical protein
LTIDIGEKTSTTSAIPPVINQIALVDDAEITIDIDTIGSTIAGFDDSGCGFESNINRKKNIINKK